MRAQAVITGETSGALFAAEFGLVAKRLQTDNAWCYTHNRALLRLLAERGIAPHRTIPPRTPKRNGKVCVPVVPRGSGGGGVR